MTVYVDALRYSPPIVVRARKYGDYWCHLLADTEEELHAFAGKIDVRRSWFQGYATPHYDLTPARRDRAVKAGAIQIDSRETVRMIRKLRAAAVDGAAKPGASE